MRFFSVFIIVLVILFGLGELPCAEVINPPETSFPFRLVGVSIPGLTDYRESLTIGGNVILSDASTVSALTTVGTLAAGNATAIVDAASLTVAGKIEIATVAETTAGSDATRAVSPDGLAGSDVMGGRAIQMVVIEFATSIATGDGQFYFHVDQRLAGMNIVDVHAEVITAGTTGTLDIQLVNVTQAAADILSTKLTIDTGETGSDTAATPAVISATEDDLQLNDLIRVDVDAVHTTPAKGLIVTIGCRLP